MSDPGDLQFVLRMQDQASAVMKQFGATVDSASSAHQSAANKAHEHEASLTKLIGVAKEAAEAVTDIWAASEISEKTLGAWGEMEESLTRLQQAAGFTSEQMEEMQGAIEKTASNSLNQTNEQISKVARSASQLGIVGVEGVNRFKDVVSQLATVTGMSVEGVTHGISQILAATGQVQGGAEQFGDAFAYLSDKTKGGGEALMSAAERLTMMTTGMKISIPEVLGMASAMEGLGLRAGRASMAMGQTLTRITDMAEQGGEKLRLLAASTGMTTDGFKQLAEEHPAEALNKFLEAVHNVQASGGSVSDFLKEIGLSGRFMETTLIAASKAIDTFKDKEKEAGEASEGALGKKHAEYMKLFEQATHAATQALVNLGEAFGKAAEPVFLVALRDAAMAVDGLREGFEKLSERGQAIIASAVILAPMVLAARSAFALWGETLLVFKALSIGSAESLGAVALAETAVGTESIAAEAGLAAVTAELGLADTAAVGLGLSLGKLNLAGIAGLAKGMGGAMISGFMIEEMVRAAILSQTKHDPGTAQGIAQIDKDHPWLAAIDNFFSKIPGLGSALGIQSYDQQDKNARGESSGTGSEGSKEPGYLHSTGIQPENFDKPIMGARFATDAAALEKLDAYQKKLDNLIPLRARLTDLETATPEQLQQAFGGADKVSVEQALKLLEVYKNIVAEQERALDPMNKLRQQWDQQLASAQALTKEAKNQADIEKAISDAKEKNPRFSAGDEAEMRSRMGANQQAAITAEYTKQMQTLHEQLTIAKELDPAAKQHLETEQKTAAAIRDQGYSLGQAAEYEKALQQIDAAKKASELNDVLEGQKTEIDQLAIMGHYREADLKTLQTINELEKKGIDVKGSGIDKEIESFNRQTQDIKEQEADLKQVESSFSGAISSGVSGALSGQKGAMANALKSFGTSMLNMGVKKLMDRMFEESGIDKMLLGPGIDKAKGLQTGLDGLIDKQVATMQVQAGVVNVNGLGAGAGAIPGLPGAGAANDNGVSLPGWPSSANLTPTGSGTGFLPQWPGSTLTPGGSGYGNMAGGVYSNWNAAAGAWSNGVPSGLGGNGIGVGAFPAFPGSSLQSAASGGWGSRAASLLGSGLSAINPISTAHAATETGVGFNALASAAMIPTAGVTAAAGESGFAGLPNLPSWSLGSARQYQQAAFNYFTSHGYSAKEAQTMMGNLQQESQFNPRSWNPNDAGPGQNSGGIYQANRARVNDLNDYMSRDTGKTIDLAHRQYGGLSDSDLFYSELGGMNADVRGQFGSSPGGALSSLRANAPGLRAGAWGHLYEGYGDTSGPTRDGYASGFSRRFGNTANLPTRDAGNMANETPFTGQGFQLPGMQPGQIDQMSKSFQTMSQSMTQTVPQIGTNLTSLSSNLGQGSSGIGSAISSLISSLTSGSGGGAVGSAVSGIAKAATAMLHDGGIVGEASSGTRMVSPSIFAFAPRYHDGLKSDEFPAVLQRGERVLTANDNARTMDAMRGMSDRISAVGQGGRSGPSVTNHYHLNNTIQTPNADSFRKTSGQVLGDASVHLQRMGVRNH